MKRDNHMSDKELDALFRNSADQDLPDFQPEAWEAMEKLLDDQDGEKGGGLSRWSALFALLMLLSVMVGYVFYRSHKNIDRTEVQSEAPSLIESEDKGQIAEEELNIDVRENQESGEFRTPRKGNNIAPEKEPSQKEKAGIDQPKAKENNNVTKQPDEKDSGMKDVVSNSLPEKKSSHGESFSRVNQVNSGPQKSNTSEGHDFVERSNQPKSIISNDHLAYSNSPDPTIPNLNSLDKLRFKAFESNWLLPEFTKVEDVLTENKSKLKEPKIGLRLAFSPDLSTVHDSPFIKVGHNFGALLEYRFNDKWSVQSGVIKSLKYYQAEAYDYAWPSNWGYKTPEGLLTVDARCNMLDIPVNLRYNITTGKNRWFISGGLTNYLMLKETYDYNYEETAPDQKYSKWEGKTGFYDAGDINTSIGFERQVSDQLSLQIEPFLKVPIQNIGFGKVKLLTTGVFVSAKIPLLK